MSNGLADVRDLWSWDRRLHFAALSGLAGSVELPVRLAVSSSFNRVNARIAKWGFSPINVPSEFAVAMDSPGIEPGVSALRTPRHSR